MISKYQGQTVILRESDTNYVPTTSSKTDDDKDIGIPQIYYCHNVIPTSEGLAAVGWRSVVNALVGVTDFTQVFTLRDTLGNKVLLGITAGGMQYVVKEGSTNWTAITPVAGSAGKKVTATFVSGVTYVYFENIGCYIYDFDLDQLTPVELVGLDATVITGIIGNSGYLIAWTKDGVAWSSTVDATDFVPSLETGAGGGGVEGARGEITVLVSTVSGFIVYTSNNAIAASYSGNARYPFNFREIVGAGGMLDTELAASEGASGVQYAYTTFGLQSVTFQQANTVLPDVTDFLSGSFFEDFNITTRQFEYTRLSAPMRKKLFLVSGRYLILSYGVSSLTHALYYDLSLKRFGKLKLSHVDCFDYSVYDTSAETAKRSIALVQANGAILTVDSDFLTESADGVLITGKYQHRRSRLLQLDSVVVENVIDGADFTMYNLPSIDGKNTTESAGYLYSDSGNQKEFLFSDVAINHSLLYIGNFSLNSLILKFNLHGRT